MFRKSSIILFFVIVAAPVYAQMKTQNTSASDINKLNWLVGHWIRSNAAPGQVGKEHWSVLSPTEMRGQGITIKGADTVFLENLAIRYHDQQLYYIVDFKGLPKPVYFKFTSLTSTGFICENPDNDFPKKIVYNRKGDNIEAYISANDKRINYLFERDDTQQ